MTTLQPEPGPTTDVRELFLTYLDFYRSSIADTVAGLTEEQLRDYRLPSGWSPIELVKHLAHMERRWLVWGVAGAAIKEPWGDSVGERWTVRPDESIDELLAELRAGGASTRRIVGSRELSSSSATGGRFPKGKEVPPSVAAVLFHVLQEYARHAGHLDIARELIDAGQRTRSSSTE
ncbi:putative damage-inducible protein DinB [Catenuloplanes nepalensis]|uniref:Damage-inducible protein DinB n=1 Tax=Catenuloplanes nepalensis TaxID=587533 RepID=A0ABT9MW56_9ACTN|nr:DinB family protein [Catenuloplanes nepalensis]MDP9795615.1 putative damage-inducible protein DinB [Catenuloplanes nepalensis]